MAFFRTTSTLYACALLSQEELQYSAQEYSRPNANVLKLEADMLFMKFQ